ncbi:MAG: metalloregulator ArsR/SmtB family transcription factor [Alcanivorax sp.]
MDIEEIEENITIAARLLKSLSNEKRLLIVCTLFKGERSVGELEEIVGLSQSALSQHLARLRRDKVVNTRREAQTIFYSLHDEAANRVLECLYTIYCQEEDFCA